MKVWLIMCGLLLRRPLVVVLLGLVYLTAALVFAGVDPAKRGMAVAVMSAFAAGGLTAVLSERIARYSFAAGCLGIPGHTQVMRQTQALFLMLFVAAPGLVACVLGLPPLATAAVLLAGTATGIALSAYGFWWIILAPAFARFSPHLDWLSLPITQAAAVAGSAWLIWRWLDLPAKYERIGQAGPLRLADSSHEHATRSAEATEHRDPAVNLFDSSVTDGSIAPISPDIPLDHEIPSGLAIGLGYSVQSDWRRTAYGAATGIGVLVGWSVFRGRQSDVMAYFVVSSVCCISLLTRLQSIMHRWMRTSTEQAILRITPLWPNAPRVKQALLQSTFAVQRGALTAWAAITLVGWSISLVPVTYIVYTAVAIVGVSLAFSGSMWATLAHRQVREWHLSTIAIVLTVGSGAVITAFGAPFAAHHVALGLFVMLTAPAAALAWYLLAPLRVPISVDPHALQTAD